MRSDSSQQWLYLVACGAEVCTPPKVCSSSWASIDWFDDESPQQPPSTRATSPGTALPLLRLVVAGVSSPYTWPMPQYTCASTHTRYLRSLRLYPLAASSLTVLS